MPSDSVPRAHWLAMVHGHIVQISAVGRLNDLRDFNYVVAFVAHLPSLVRSELVKRCISSTRRAEAFDFSLQVDGGHTILIHVRLVLVGARSTLLLVAPSKMIAAQHALALLFLPVALFLTLKLALLLVQARLAELFSLLHAHDLALAALRLAPEAVFLASDVEFLGTFYAEIFFFSALLAPNAVTVLWANPAFANRAVIFELRASC